MDAHGWRVFVHPLFASQLEKLTLQVTTLASEDPQGYVSHPAAKLLATINHYIMEAIPRDPNSSEFRQGNTLGPGNRHWFRAKFHGRYRLFYRFSSQDRVIIYVWINDETSLRKEGSKTDPYVRFKAMLETGDPPGSFADLLRASQALK
jgi:toxin YhaV